MNFRKLLPSCLVLAGSIALFFYTYQDFSWQELKEGFKKCYFRWIAFASISHLINHMLRSYRWSLLLRAQGITPPLYKIYLSEMSGFCVNGLGGRLGEYARCESLKRLHGAPINRSFATVVIERVVDILFFCLIFLFFLCFYSKTIHNVLNHLWTVTREKSQGLSSTSSLLTTSLIVSCLLLLFLWALKSFPEKIRKFLKEFKHAIKTTTKANSFTFWTITALIWLFYFLLEYVSLFAIAETAGLTDELGLAPIICVFIALNISHMVPTGNGLGAYHLLVITVLKYFGVSKKPAAIYAVITHGIQTFNALFFGGLCLLSVLILFNKKNHKKESMNKQHPPKKLHP